LNARPEAQARLAAEVSSYRAFSLSGHDDRAALAAASAAIDYFSGTVQVRLAELLLQRGRIYKRLGDLDQASADWARGVQIIEDQRPALRTELLRISRTAALWDVFGELIDHSRNRPEDALALAERAKARELISSLAPDQHAEAFSWDRLRQALDDGAQAVVFAQLPQRLLIWVVDVASVRLVERRVTPVEVRDLARRFVASIESGHDPRAGLELAQLLLPPTIEYRRDRPLVVVPDGVLHGVPFSALPVPGRDEFLVEASIPVVAPSLAAFALASSRTRADARPHLLAVGVGSAAPELALPFLPAVERETKSVSVLYGDRSRVLTGEGASATAVLTSLDDAGVVHFAGHAVLDPVFPARSRLLVTDGSIGSSEIAAAGMRAGTVVVLSACDTAIGQTFRGEGPISLVRAFLAGGASGIVATLWKVRDDDAATVMPLVHAYLSKGNGAAESLARAQRDLIARRVAPASWAAFSAMGGVRASETD
jgi:CHAT domain-containing protein